MECRTGCGACCVAISISAPIPGMPHGKPAGVRCIHLSADYRCHIYHDPEKPEVCKHFHASPEVCGSTRDEALQLLTELETATGG